MYLDFIDIENYNKTCRYILSKVNTILQVYTVGSSKLSEFISVLYCTVPYRSIPQQTVVLKDTAPHKRN